MSQRVFICYARVDQPFALPLAEQLKARGIGVWIDKWDARPGGDWDRDIDLGLRECSHLLIVLSPASVDSREVRGELRTALDLGKRLLPVLYQRCEIPRQLRVVQFVDFSGRSPDDASALNELLGALSTPGPAAPALASPAPPRRGARFAWLRALSVRTKAAVGAVLVLLVAGLAWFGLEERRLSNREVTVLARRLEPAYRASLSRTELASADSASVEELRQSLIRGLFGSNWLRGLRPVPGTIFDPDSLEEKVFEGFRGQAVRVLAAHNNVMTSANSASQLPRSDVDEFARWAAPAAFAQVLLSNELAADLKFFVSLTSEQRARVLLGIPPSEVARPQLDDVWEVAPGFRMDGLKPGQPCPSTAGAGVIKLRCEQLERTGHQLQRLFDGASGGSNETLQMLQSTLADIIRRKLQLLTLQEAINERENEMARHVQTLQGSLPVSVNTTSLGSLLIR